MVNYYKQFKSFAEQNTLKDRTKIPLEEFRSLLMIYFGFGDHAVRAWMENFQDAGLIRMEKDDSEKWFVMLL